MTSDSSRATSPADAEEFTRWATSPSVWFRQAEQLRLSSELLWKPIDRLFDLGRKNLRDVDSDESEQAALHAPAYLMIAGFAVEAMLKAAAIQVELNAGGLDRIIVVGPVPTLRPWVKTHKVEKLALRAGIAYSEELLIYLRRLEKYVVWAGRYPVPVGPPAEAETRGFEYQIGSQDRPRFHEIYDRAKDAYVAACAVKKPWLEPTENLGQYRVREAAWVSTSTEWLRVARHALLAHSRRVSAGDRGVLQLSVDIADMKHHLSAPTTFVTFEPVWLPAEEFLSLVAADVGIGDATSRRWAGTLLTMDPERDVALFLCSSPDSDGRWFSRYVFLREDESEATVG